VFRVLSQRGRRNFAAEIAESEPVKKRCVAVAERVKQIGKPV
jgi:hypothetical protein